MIQCNEKSVTTCIFSCNQYNSAYGEIYGGELQVGTENLERLIVLGKQGDKKAIEEILKLYERLIKKCSRSYYIRGYDEEDLEQIARLMIIKAIDKFNFSNGANFTGFAEVLIRNAFKTILNRKENTMIYPSLESVNEEGVELKEMFPDDFDLEGFYIENCDKLVLREILLALDIEDRKLLLMSFSEYGGLKEYSKLTGIPYYTCRRKRDRLLEKIKKKLAKNI